MFYEAVRITETDLPVLTCAGVKFADTGLCNICIGARPGKAVIVKDTYDILSSGISEESIEKFADFVEKICQHREICVEVPVIEAISQVFLQKEL